MTIHREGRSILLILLSILLGLNVLTGLLAPSVIAWITLSGSAILFFLILQFFRSPAIRVAKDEALVLAPADGKVVSIEETEEPEVLRDRRRLVSIFMSPLNVHINRMPVDGKVTYVRYHPGQYLVACHPKSSTLNERTTIVVQTRAGLPVLVRQIAGAVARRIKWYIKEDEQVEQGAEFGFIKFGSRVDVFLPLTARILVKPGAKTVAGVTPIASFDAG